MLTDESVASKVQNVEATYCASETGREMYATTRSAALRLRHSFLIQNTSLGQTSRVATLRQNPCGEQPLLYSSYYCLDAKVHQVPALCMCTCRTLSLSNRRLFNTQIHSALMLGLPLACSATEAT